MDDINHVSYRLCAKNASEDHSFDQLSLLKCAENAHILDRSSYTPNYLKHEQRAAPSFFSPQRAGRGLRRTELWAGPHVRGQCKKGGSFDKTILHKLRSRLKKRESKYHCGKNLKESRMIFPWESR